MTSLSSHIRTLESVNLPARMGLHRRSGKVLQNVAEVLGDRHIDIRTVSSPQIDSYFHELRPVATARQITDTGEPMQHAYLYVHE
jgi:hypothetical protein